MANKQTSKPRMSTFFVPGIGIDREVITTDICRYLGNDALVKPGPYQDPRSGEVRHGYFVTAYRALTTEQLADLKADSLRWEAERRKNPSSRGLTTGGISPRSLDFIRQSNAIPDGYKASSTRRQQWGPAEPQMSGQGGYQTQQVYPPPGTTQARETQARPEYDRTFTNPSLGPSGTGYTDFSSPDSYTYQQAQVSYGVQPGAGLQSQQPLTNQAPQRLFQSTNYQGDGRGAPQASLGANRNQPFYELGSQTLANTQMPPPNPQGPFPGQQRQEHQQDPYYASDPTGQHPNEYFEDTPQYDENPNLPPAHRSDRDKNVGRRPR